ncbi:MAG: hypothetical protein EZS28_031337 [Streblomastix strix]|uniref:Uncharacterized protein n=1 Tax=Streblomastix strix TaxID=222440 RepID=A0A5J4URW3_9EUKA|nr:MAG: hypothetical protein EZS28_031337 [Streblomastix strix]
MLLTVDSKSKRQRKRTLHRVTRLLANDPTGIENVNGSKEVPAELQFEFKNSSISSLYIGESIVYATYTISRGGVVDSSCIPNTKQPEDITQFGVVQIQEGLIIGWEGRKWIYADRGTDKYSFRTLAID